MNINIKHIEEMTGFRKPTDEEAKVIYRYMYDYYNKRNRSDKTLFFIFAILGIVSFSAYPSKGIAAVIVGLLSFAICILNIILLHSEKGYANIYKKQQYRVLEGYVSEVAVNTIDNAERIKFTSWEGQSLNRWYDLETTGCNIGDVLLLIAPNPCFLEPHILTAGMLGK